MIRWLKHKTKRSKREGKHEISNTNIDPLSGDISDKDNHAHIYEEIPDLIPTEYRNGSSTDIPCFFLVGTSSIAEIDAPRDEVCHPYMVVPVRDLCSYETPLSCQGSPQGSLRRQQPKSEKSFDVGTFENYRDNTHIVEQSRTGVDNCRALLTKPPSGTVFRINSRNQAKFLTELNEIIDNGHMAADGNSNDSFDTASLTTVSSMSSAYGWVRTDMDSETEVDSDSDEDGYIICTGSSRPSSRCSSAEYESSTLSSNRSSVVSSSRSSSTFSGRHHKSSTSARDSTCSSLSEMSCEDSDTSSSADEFTRKQIGGENYTSDRSRSNKDLSSAFKERNGQRSDFRDNYMPRNRLLGDLIRLNYDRQMFASL